MSRTGTSQASKRKALSFNTVLRNLLRTRNNYVKKIKELDEQITTLLRENTPSTNEQSLQLLRTALSAASVNFNDTFIEYHRPNQSQLVIAQRNRVLLNFPVRVETTQVTSSTPPPFENNLSSQNFPVIKLEPTNDLQLPEGINTVRETDSQPARVETPTRNIINLEELGPPTSYLEHFLARP